MHKLIAGMKTAGEAVFLLLIAPLLLLGVMAALALADLLDRLRRQPPLPPDQAVRTDAVSVVIPTWNGRHHLEQNLPSVIVALRDHPNHELIVVDDASTDGTAEFLKERFPGVRVIELEENLGFGGCSNAGFRAARHDVVVLLNNDMRVEPDFLAPLLRGFSDPRVFAVSAQIYFFDPKKRREETGLTRGEWLNGRLHLRQVADEKIHGLFPVFYAGGGSSAFDRRKFLALGGFDPILSPFYLEDTDISYMAWKRGWVILYQPKSVVHHEHRGTIGKRFSAECIDTVLQKNHLLFTWKNIHEWKRLAPHFFWLYGGLWLRFLAGPTPTRPSCKSLLHAVKKAAAVLRARRRARMLSVMDDTEAFRRPLGGYFRDRFSILDSGREKLRVLFVSPYPMEPPLHGGAVFMSQTIRQLARLAHLHLVCLLDEPEDLETNRSLAGICESAEFIVRWKDHSRGIGALQPHAAQTFYSPDFLWTIHRNILQHEIDVVQLDYTQLASYAADFRQIATFLFEHDIYFQSIRRSMKGLHSPLPWIEHGYEYLRALRFERRALRSFDAIQVCTAANRRYLESYSWDGAPIREGLRAGIDVRAYRFVESGREPDTLLFVGNFRHTPNQRALEFFVRRVLPLISRQRPAARLVIVGAQAPPGFDQLFARPGIEFVGMVPDIRLALERYAVFVCPILSGSGVRVKLLEAFAAGIPVVSTTIGAEGLLEGGARHLEVADTAEEFAARVVDLLSHPRHARDLARRARREVEEKWDVEAITTSLERHYRQVLREKLNGRRSPTPVPLSIEAFEAAPRAAARQDTSPVA